MKALNTHHNRSHSTWPYTRTRLTIAPIRHPKTDDEVLRPEGRAKKLLMPCLRVCQTKPTQWRTHIWTSKVLPLRTRNQIRSNTGRPTQAEEHQQKKSNYTETTQSSIKPKLNSSHRSVKRGSQYWTHQQQTHTPLLKETGTVQTDRSRRRRPTTQRHGKAHLRTRLKPIRSIISFTIATDRETLQENMNIATAVFVTIYFFSS